ncbi:plastocyanin/azurin family copper-binding protein [Patulibacter sp. NPDC049589]|uniref:cupredoxin domain-containing protein n=1 Tax=Patulibacter sp. NPDC049589 TaxID=3154731 RepID=UPI0034354BAF
MPRSSGRPCPRPRHLRPAVALRPHGEGPRHRPVALVEVATKTTTVEVIDHRFVPATLSVRAGTTVKWVWGNRSRHNARAAKGPITFDSGPKLTGAFKKKLTKKGTYLVVCDPHLPCVKMTIKVKQCRRADPARHPRPGVPPPGASRVSGRRASRGARGRCGRTGRRRRVVGGRRGRDATRPRAVVAPRSPSIAGSSRPSGPPERRAPGSSRSPGPATRPARPSSSRSTTALRNPPRTTGLKVVVGVKPKGGKTVSRTLTLKR